MPKRYKADGDHVLILRACRLDMTSRGNNFTGMPFKYPKRGKVTAPKWNNKRECGTGLHGWLWGFGSASLVPWYARPRGMWLVIRVLCKDMIKLDCKVKFREGTVVFCGGKREAGRYIRARRPKNCDTVYGDITKWVGHQ